MRDGDGLRIRRNRELYGYMDVVKFIKQGRLSWTGHIARMEEEEEMPKKIGHRGTLLRRPRPIQVSSAMYID